MAIQPANKPELIRSVDRWELRIRRIGSQWSDSLPVTVRAELLSIANSMLRVLLRERPPRR